MTSARGWLWLLRRALSRRAAPHLLVVFCTTLATVVTMLAVAAVLFLEGPVRARLQAAENAGWIVARPQTVDIAVLRLQGTAIDAGTIARVAALEGVESVHAQQSAAFPVSVLFRIPGLGDEYSSDMILQGAPLDLVAEDLNAAARAAWLSDEPEPVPALISAYFLDIYNLGMAEAAGLPKVAPAALIGRELRFHLGESTLGIGAGASQPRIVRARIVGLSRNTHLMGVIVPDTRLEAWNTEFARSGAKRITALHARVAPTVSASAVAQRIEGAGLRVASGAEAFQRLADALAVARASILGAAALVVALAAVGAWSLGAATVRARRGQWALLRAAGYTGGDIVRLALGESFVVAGASGVLASVATMAVLSALSRAYGEAAQAISFIGTDPFQAGAAVYAFAVLTPLVLVVPPVLLALVRHARAPIAAELATRV